MGKKSREPALLSSPPQLPPPVWYEDFVRVSLGKAVLLSAAASGILAALGHCLLSFGMFASGEHVLVEATSIFLFFFLFSFFLFWLACLLVVSSCSFGFWFERKVCAFASVSRF